VEVIVTELCAERQIEEALIYQLNIIRRRRRLAEAEIDFIFFRERGFGICAKISVMGDDYMDNILIQSPDLIKQVTSIFLKPGHKNKGLYNIKPMVIRMLRQSKLKEVVASF